MRKNKYHVNLQHRRKLLQIFFEVAAADIIEQSTTKTHTLHSLLKNKNFWTCSKISGVALSRFLSTAMTIICVLKHIGMTSGALYMTDFRWFQSEKTKWLRYGEHGG